MVATLKKNWKSFAFRESVRANFWGLFSKKQIQLIYWRCPYTSRRAEFKYGINKTNYKSLLSKLIDKYKNNIINSKFKDCKLQAVNHISNTQLWNSSKKEKKKKEKKKRIIVTTHLEHPQQMLQKNCHFAITKTYFIILPHHFTKSHLLIVLSFNSIH